MNDPGVSKLGAQGPCRLTWVFFRGGYQNGQLGMATDSVQAEAAANAAQGQLLAVHAGG